MFDQGLGEIVRGLSQRLHATLADCVPTQGLIAHLDHPLHGNVGDHAIWLGERMALRRLHARTVHVSTIRSYDREAIAAAIGGGSIVIHGGGNLGDLWPQHQKFREQVIQDFPNNRVIQLAQSVHFEDPTNAAAARACFKSHGGVTLLVRDRASLRRASELLGIEAVLCPDMAFALGPLGRCGHPLWDTVFLRRRDKEAPDATVAQRARELLREDTKVIEDDWAQVGGQEQLLSQLDALYPSVFRSRIGHRLLRGMLYDRQSSICLRRGIGFLSRGRRVITDRLHGFILCVLLGISVIPLDNSTGKISSFIDTWFPEGAGSSPDAP